MFTNLSPLFLYRDLRWLFVFFPRGAWAAWPHWPALLTKAWQPVKVPVSWDRKARCFGDNC